MDELSNVLDKSEKVLWKGAPQFWPYFAGAAVLAGIVSVFLFSFLVMFGMVFLGVFAGFALVGSAAGAPPAFIGIPLLFGLPLILMSGIFLLVLFVPAAYAYLSHKHTQYAITDKRVIMQSGIIGRDYKTIDFDQISNAEVNVGIFDKLFGKDSGSIILRTAGDPVVCVNDSARQQSAVLSSITSPYVAFKFLRKVSFDVKTDMEYPNKYRPKTNPGYKTEYSNKKKR